MSQQAVDVGSAANDGTGDDPRTSFTKLNANDAELYASVASLTGAVAADGAAIAALGVDLAALDGTVDAQAVSITSLDAGLTALQGTVATDHATLVALGGDVVTLQGTVAGLGGDVTALQGDVTALQADMTAVEAAVAAIAPAAGASGSVQFSDGSGGLLASAGIMFDSTNKSLTIDGGTVNTALPILKLLRVWNAIGTAFKGLTVAITNTAAATGSRIFEFLAGAAGTTEVCYLTKDGYFAAKRFASLDGFSPFGWDQIRMANGVDWIFSSYAQDVVSINGQSQSLTLQADSFLGWSNTASPADTRDTRLYRDAANIVAQRNGTAAQKTHIYKTRTDGSNYARLVIDCGVADVQTLAIRGEAAGTGAYSNVDIGYSNTKLLRFNAADAILYGLNLLPGYDNLYNLGAASYGWKELFCDNGTINTSDARRKTDVKTFATNEIAAATQLAAEIGWFKFLAAVEAKGESARRHVGMTVQRCIEIMEANSLDAFEWGMVCHDEWPDQFEQVQTNAGEKITLTRKVTREAFTLEQTEQKIVEIIDGKPVLVVRMVEERKPVVEHVQVLDEAGNPVLVVREEGGKPEPLTHPMPVMEEAEESCEVDAEPVFEQRLVRAAGDKYSFRVHELWGFILAGVHARLVALEAA